MPTITSAGVGSGLDINSLVAQLVAAERAPVANRLTRQESTIRVELSAFGQFRNALSAFDSALEKLSNADTLDGRGASSSDEEVFTASVQSGAALGRFSVQVEQLAQAHRMASTTPYASVDDPVGYGTLQLDLGSDSFSVEIDPAAQSLAEVRDAINNAADNPGVRATILNTDSGAILQLSSDRTGADSEIQLSSSGGDGELNTFIANLGQTQAQQDAIVYVDGYQVTSSSNSLDGVLQGVTINLNEARPGEVFDLNVSRDNNAAVEVIKEFVNTYNSFVDQAKSLGGYNADTEVAGTLNGDSILRGATNQLRQALTGSYGEGDEFLSAFGIGLDVDGRLSFDETELSSVLDADFSKLRDFLSGDDGFVASLQGITGGYVDDDGIIGGRVDSLNQRLDRIEERNEALDARMERIEARYLAQFSALDVMLSQLQQTSSYLSQQLASLPGVANSNE
ncbi:flagellar filament capping protein FliD [Oceanococcus atlanticus]|uniref:flagellar filament capping protein FliD n=1 Tax=Oceanococcus atlanticus TaxID=1317117 RepID=UPI0009FA098A|nr:flagellar filament capping protein FliD [Oceanococcus atlanticus]